MNNVRVREKWSAGAFLYAPLIMLSSFVGVDLTLATGIMA
jgi:hypothetical protein